MDIKEIVQLIERFDTSKATKLQLKSGDTELVLESAAVQIQPVEMISVAKPVIGNNGIAVQQPVQENSSGAAGNSGKNEGASKTVTAEVDGIPVKAPLVGTFYCAPSPEDKPFVSVGQSVKKGDVIGIIEAMKLMNEITAPEDGVVKRIFAENGNMVEYGEVLMVLE